jgi:hypothetical protein
MRKNLGKRGPFIGKKKIVFGYLGALFIISLFVSSACAAPIVQTSHLDTSLKSNNITTKTAVTIDPNICLTKKQLPILKKAVTEISNPTNKKIVQSIIDTLEKKGVVGQSEIKEIVNDLQANILGISCGFVHGNGNGDAFLFRGPIQVLLFFIEQAILLVSYHALGIVVFWHSLDPVRVNLKVYTEETYGTIIGYLGFEWSGGNPWNGVFYGMIGFGALIIVTGV